MAFGSIRRAIPSACRALLLASLMACDGSARTDDASDTAHAAPIATGDSTGSISDAPVAPRASTMANSALDDTSVMRLIAAVDRGEAAAGRQAVLKATQSDVKAYGRRIMEEHDADLTELQRLAAAANIGLEGTLAVAGSDNPAVVQLHQNLEATMSQLRVATGVNFDRQYISSQLAGHQQVLALLRENESRLHNSDVRRHVAGMMTLLEKHLERARRIQLKLRVDSTTSAGSVPRR